MKALAFLVCVCVGVSGCAAQLAQRDDAECKSIGAHPGTPSYVDCRLRKEQMRNATANAILMSP
jgi:hypothetical protein